MRWVKYVTNHEWSSTSARARFSRCLPCTGGALRSSDSFKTLLFIPEVTVDLRYGLLLKIWWFEKGGKRSINPSSVFVWPNAFGEEEAFKVTKAAEILGTKDLLLSWENGAENELRTVFENHTKSLIFDTFSSTIWTLIPPKSKRSKIEKYLFWGELGFNYENL